MPQRDGHDHAALLLAKAQDDKLVVDKLTDDLDISDDMIGFHAQQAVEKSLKAILADHEVEYPRVHDIDRLVDLLEAHNIDLPPHARRLDELTPWATQLRYVDLLDIEALARKPTAQLVEEVVNWARTKLESPAA